MQFLLWFFDAQAKVMACLTTASSLEAPPRSDKLVLTASSRTYEACSHFDAPVVAIDAWLDAPTTSLSATLHPSIRPTMLHSSSRSSLSSIWRAIRLSFVAISARSSQTRMQTFTNAENRFYWFLWERVGGHHRAATCMGSDSFLSLFFGRQKHDSLHSGSFRPSPHVLVLVWRNICI